MLDDVRALLATRGFDIAHVFDAAVVAREPGLAVLGEGVGLLVGNTRALWPIFLAALPDDADPLDRYTEDAIAPLGRAYFAHRKYGGSYLPFQRLAVAAGLAALAPNHLVIHPIYGPWFALRAVIVFPGSARYQIETKPIPLPCCCGASCTAPTTDDWHSWLAIRDSCSLGSQWRYSEDQLRYHYTKDRSILRRTK